MSSLLPKHTPDASSPKYPAFERHYRIAELAAIWRLGRETVRLLVRNEKGVIKVRLGRKKAHTTYSVPESVAMRIQLEGLYTLCLLIEQPQHVDRFVKEAWKRQYIRYLLMREETKGLDRFVEAQSDVQELSRLLKLATVWNVTEAERLTIEYDELETSLPPAFVREPIRNFPTPGGVIKELPAGPKRAMLELLYIEYQDLCTYAHGRPIAGFNKTVFDVRSPLRNMFPMAEIQKTFQQRIEADCQVYSLMSIAQSAAELTTLCPNDLDLASAVTRAWNELHNAHMLANAVWNIRTKGLLGVVG